MNDYYKYPRLYVQQALAQNASPKLEPGQVHYLKNVLRLKEDSSLRLFDGQNGEWLGRLTELRKKDATIKLNGQIKTQPPKPNAVHLLFAPIKKQRLDFLIEKSIELGATDLHPILTNHTEVRKIKEARLQAQMIEATEQCERLDIPVLHPLMSISEAFKTWNYAIKITACLERYDAPHISEISFGENKAFLIGPEGGFDETEKEMIAACSFVQPVNLGESVLRAETAALKCLSLIA